MRKSEIKIVVELDEKQVPEKIYWDAEDNPNGVPQETKSVSLSLWDHVAKNTMRIDLWSKDMPVDEMKRFYIDCIGGLAQSALTATGDEVISSKLNALCDELVEHLKTEQ